MSDAEKPTRDSPSGGDPSTKASPATNVISIEQARAELLRRPRARATPPRGVDGGVVRSRSREPPPAVTLPPGEHSAVIVTDTPAARAHIDKKTVHPGEAPEETHQKKVRVKTHLDPRRAKTQLSERRASAGDPAAAGDPSEALRESEPPASGTSMGSLWSSRPPPPLIDTPQAVTPGSRVSLARNRTYQREHRPGSPLFLVGVVLAASLGAVVVYSLSRKTGQPDARPVATATVTATSVPAAVTVPPATTTGPAATTSATGAPLVASGTATATATETPTPSPPAVSSPPVVRTGPAPSTKTTAAAPATSATAKPATTNVLPFGKEED